MHYCNSRLSISFPVCNPQDGRDDVNINDDFYPLTSINCFCTIYKRPANFLSSSKPFKIYSACFLFFFLTSKTAVALGDKNSINLKLQNSSIVHLPAGTYVLTDSIILQSNNVLEGEPGTILKLVDNAGWPTWQPLISGKGVSNVTIRNLEIDGNDQNQDNAPTWSGHSGNQKSSRGMGNYNFIHCIDCDSINVNSCLFHDGLYDGFRVKTSTNIKFYDNTAYRLGHDVFYGIDSQNIEAYNNRITTSVASMIKSLKSYIE